MIALEQSGNVSAAAAAAGVSRWTAYDRREHHPEFAAAWQHALDVAVDGLEVEARRRAMTGSDVLLIFLLKAHRPQMYREKVEQQHSGQVTVRVIYDDPGIPGSPSPSARGSTIDSLEYK